MANLHRNSCRTCLLAVWFAYAATCGSFARTSLAVDTVRLTAGSESARTTLSGEIVEIAGQTLRINTGTSKERAIPLSRVAEISTTSSDRQRAADALFAKRDYRGAVDQYRAALQGDRENRDWVRRQIVAQMVWCYRYLGMDEQAGEYFLILLAGDPTTPYFDAIPLAWRGGEPTPAVEAKAKVWLGRSDSPAAQLMGASHLLNTSENPRMAERLRRLATDRDVRIAWLAEVQLWRTQAVTANDTLCGQWQTAIDAGPEALRAGAYFVLAGAWKNRRPDTAAITYLRLPVLYPRERALCAASLVEAAAQLEADQKPREAKALYQELLTEYAEQPEARARKHKISAAEQGAP